MWEQLKSASAFRAQNVCLGTLSCFTGASDKMKRGAEIKQEMLSGVSGYEDLVRGVVWWTQTLTDESAVRLRCGRDSHIWCPRERADCRVSFIAQRDSGGCDWFISVCLSVIVCGSWCTPCTDQGSVLTQTVITPGSSWLWREEYQPIRSEQTLAACRWSVHVENRWGALDLSAAVWQWSSCLNCFFMMCRFVFSDELWRRLMLCYHVSEVPFMLVLWVCVVCTVFVVVAMNIQASAALMSWRRLSWMTL